MDVVSSWIEHNGTSSVTSAFPPHFWSLLVDSSITEFFHSIKLRASEIKQDDSILLLIESDDGREKESLRGIDWSSS